MFGLSVNTVLNLAYTTTISDLPSCINIVEPSSSHRRSHHGSSQAQHTVSLTGKLLYTINNHPSNKLRNSAFVTIEIGPDKTLYTVMKELLCLHSRYFRTAFESFDGIEARTEKIMLEDVTEDIFDTCINWLVVQKVKLAGSTSVEEMNSALELTDLYTFADKYNIIDLRRTCINLFVPFFKLDAGWVQHPLRHVVLQLAFEKLPATSGFHSMLADQEVLRT